MSEPQAESGPSGPAAGREREAMSDQLEHLDPVAERHRHPVRGLFAGLLLGLGLALLLFTYAKIAIGTLAFPLVIVAGIVVGLLVGILAPPRGGRRA